MIWGHINGVIANSIGEKLELVVKEIQRSWIEVWKAVGMLKYPLSSVTCAWEIKEHALELLSDIMERDSLDEPKDQNFDFSSFVPIIFTTLQVNPFSLEKFSCTLPTKPTINLILNSHYFLKYCRPHKTPLL